MQSILCGLAYLGYCQQFYLEKDLNHALMFGFTVKNKRVRYALFPPLTQLKS